MIEKIETKGERLKKYLSTKEKTEVLLLNNFLEGSISQKIYSEEIQKSEKEYRIFLKELE